MASTLPQITLPITETSNVITEEFDAMDGVGMLRLLRQVDEQMFAGYRYLPSMLDSEMLQVMDRISVQAQELLSSPTTSIIVFTGCGTSGRISYYCARSLNRLAAKLGKPQLFRYFISGGDKALLRSDERKEDDPEFGVNDLKSIEGDFTKIMLVGITCGVSAPYVLGQIKYALNDSRYSSVLLGFNPIHLARNVVMENWDETCLSVATALNQSIQNGNTKHFILNPVLGPEAITGSTRMKGGSATKILLEVIFSHAISRSWSSISLLETPHTQSSQTEISDLLLAYNSTSLSTYSYAKNLGEIVNLAGTCLKSGGHIYYVGRDSLGVLGFIDASEMFDTYGENLLTIRGFINDGWDTIDCTKGDMSHFGELFHISTKHFKEKIVAELTPNDCVVFSLLQDKETSYNEEWLDLIGSVKNAGAKAGVFIISRQGDTSPSFTLQPDVFVNVKLPKLHLIESTPSLAEFACKLILNGISTGACTMKGRVYRNTMINLAVSNNKLFHRSIRIISRLSGATEKVSRESLLKAIYKVETVTEEMENAHVSAIVKISTPLQQIVPTAILVATGKFTVAQAVNELAQDPAIRNIIERNSATK